MKSNITCIAVWLVAIIHILFFTPASSLAGSLYMTTILQDGGVVSLDIYHFNKGKVRLGIFYQPGEEKTQNFFPSFLDLADQARLQETVIIPYSLDSSTIAIAYLSEAPDWLRRQSIHNRKASEVIGSLKAKGHNLENSIETPYVFVIDKEGQLLFEQQGIDDIDSIAAALKKAGVDVLEHNLSKSSVGRDFAAALQEMKFREIVSQRKVSSQIGEEFKDDFFELFRLGHGSYKTVKITEESCDSLCSNKKMKNVLSNCNKTVYVHLMEDKLNQRRTRAFYCADSEQVELLDCFYQYKDDRWVVVNRDKQDVYYGRIIGTPFE